MGYALDLKICSVCGVGYESVKVQIKLVWGYKRVVLVLISGKEPKLCGGYCEWRSRMLSNYIW